MNFRVRFHRDELGTVLEREGRTSDLSLGGAFVETDQPPALGHRLVLVLKSPTAWDPLEIRAEVRWISDGSGPRPTGFGVRFHSLGRTEIAALYDLIHATAFMEDAE